MGICGERGRVSRARVSRVQRACCHRGRRETLMKTGLALVVLPCGSFHRPCILCRFPVCIFRRPNHLYSWCPRSRGLLELPVLVRSLFLSEQTRSDRRRSQNGRRWRVVNLQICSCSCVPLPRKRSKNSRLWQCLRRPLCRRTWTSSPYCKLFCA